MTNQSLYKLRTIGLLIEQYLGEYDIFLFFYFDLNSCDSLTRYSLPLLSRLVLRFPPEVVRD